MKLSEDLAWRGLIKDKTFEDIGWLDQGRAFYHGVDASADSLHIGNLAAMLTARRLIDGGWKAVLLAGGATSLIGDPGGKDEERELKSRKVIQMNVEAIKRQIGQLFAGEDFMLVDNYDWFSNVGYLEFLREVGKHYSMTELVQRDFVNDRMGEGGSGISYAEFSYSLVQGYDYWQLYKNHKVVLQIGGSDQWGNMLSGVPLIRKKEGAQVHALSMPLVINKASGRKFGKSEAGAVWLDSTKTSPTQFYQFWVNTDDDDTENYLKIFTLLPKDEIEAIVKQHKSDPQKRSAQTRLAAEVTDLVHGKDMRKFAQDVTKYLTGEVPVADASEAALKEVRKALPNIKVQPGTPLFEVIVSSGLASSNTEARRLVQGQAVYVDNESFSKVHLESKDFKNGRLMLRRGKAYKDAALIELA
jgi:tyrosyl-tRNA synthetase